MSKAKSIINSIPHEALGDELKDFVTNVESAEAALREIKRDLKSNKMPSQGSWALLMTMMTQILKIGVNQKAAGDLVFKAKKALK